MSLVAGWGKLALLCRSLKIWLSESLLSSSYSSIRFSAMRFLDSFFHEQIKNTISIRATSMKGNKRSVPVSQPGGLFAKHFEGVSVVMHPILS